MSARGMGKGLAALLPEAAQAGGDELRELPLGLISPNPRQPRSHIEPESLATLARSVAANGVIQPVIVRPLAGGRYELVAGERRWRAAREAGLEAIPEIVRDEAEERRLQTALIENVAREDLNPIDEARACAALVEELGLSKEELAGRLGRSRAALSNLIRLLDLPDAALDLLESGELSAGHGRAILQARAAEARTELARRAAAEGWSVRETEHRARAAEKPARPRLAAVPDADRDDAVRRVEEALEAALGVEVKIRATARGAIRAELRLDSVEQALALAGRLQRRRAA